jgi:cytochrome c6
MVQQAQHRWQQWWLWAVLGAVALVAMVGLGGAPAWGDTGSINGPLDATAEQPAQLFSLHCAGCHPHGGNIIRRSKTLQAKALKRYGYDDMASIATIIANGKGIMSAYQDRLTPTEITSLAEYVWQQAETGW